MKTEHFFRDADGSVLAVVTLLVAAILGTLGLTLSDESFDTTQGSAVSSAHAVAAPVDVPNVIAASASAEWNADESAQGTRPDAAH